MMRAVPALIVVACVLSGCAATTVDSLVIEPEPVESSEPASPAPTPTPTESPIVFVDAADYATQIDGQADGVDFDSADRNVRCGIWSAYEYYGGDLTVEYGPYAGCRPLEATYSTEPAVDPYGEIGCSGGELFGDLPAFPVCNSGVVFVGEDPAHYTVAVLDRGVGDPMGGLHLHGHRCRHDRMRARRGRRRVHRGARELPLLLVHQRPTNRSGRRLASGAKWSVEGRPGDHFAPLGPTSASRPPRIVRDGRIRARGNRPTRTIRRVAASARRGRGPRGPSRGRRADARARACGPRAGPSPPRGVT